ncbi:surfeit locus protein 1 [Planococcus citri]|uniref:surfeit locus protein 1 n=1 Tax=Planococcus citri TaxID=170843 RepID=UPI0031F9A599
MVGLLSKPSSCLCRILYSRSSPSIIKAVKLHEQARVLKYGKHDTENYLNKKTVKNNRGPFAYVLLMFPLTCFGLAYWQYNRKLWKETLIHDMKMKTFIPAIDLPQDLTNKRKLEYRRVKVRGTFDHSKEMYLSPRSLIQNNEFSKDDTPFLSPLAKADTNLGAVVVTPFKLADRDLTILVNRGWVPYDKLDPNTRQEAQIEGEVELEGIVRTQEDKPMIGSEHDIRKRTFKYRDVEEMAEMADTSYLFIDCVNESSVPGGPIGGQTQVNLRNEHFQYIVTWLSIAILLSYMWHKRWVRFLN